MAVHPIKTESDLRDLHRRFFTASRIASLYGQGRTTLREEAEILLGRLDPPEVDNVLMRRGQRLEKVIDDMLRGGEYTAQDELPDHPFRIRKAGGLYAHPTIDRFGATPDRLVRLGSWTGGLGEYKAVAEPIFNDAWADGPPLTVELQHQAQLACTGATWGIIAALVVGAYTFDLYVWHRDRHPQAVQKIEADVSNFLDQVRHGPLPAWDFSADGATIARLYQEATAGSVIDLTGDNYAESLAGEYKAAAEAEKEARARKDAAKAELLTKIGDAERAYLGGYTISAKTVPPKRIEYDRRAYRNFQVTAKKQKEAA
jgi:hypothetical protein